MQDVRGTHCNVLLAFPYIVPRSLQQATGSDAGDADLAKSRKKLPSGQASARDHIVSCELRVWHNLKTVLV